MRSVNVTPARAAAAVLSILLLSWLGQTTAPAAEENSAYLTAWDSITTANLKQHVDFLADDAREGREAGSQGGRASGDYLAARFAEFQLQPRGNDGYFQPFRAGFRNVLGLLPGSDPRRRHEVIVLSAHYDHVGYGNRQNSRGPIGYVHNGADDNASGTSGLLELAEAFSMLPEPSARSILFAAWDAEEMGLFGSKHWIAHPTVPREEVVFLLNMDMIGRLRDNRLVVMGTRSGLGLRRFLSTHNWELSLDFPWTTKPNADHWPFFDADIPFLTLNTGLHDDYHTPADDAELINNRGMRKVVRLVFESIHDLANADDVPDFRAIARHETDEFRRRRFGDHSRPTRRLGVQWKEPDTPTTGGLFLTSVATGSPAEQASLRPGDRIIRVAKRDIRNGDDLRYAVLSAENPVEMVVRRPDESEPRKVTAQLDGKPMRLGISWAVDPAEADTIVLTRVVPGSPSDRAGLEPGDRIYQVGGKDFTDDRQFAERVKNLPGPLELLVERDGRLRTVLLHLDGESHDRAA